MIRGAALFTLAFCLIACALAAGCAAPGEPTFRHPVVPVAVTDLGARQSASAITLTFTLPTRSADRKPLSERPTIEIYRTAILTGASPNAIDKKTAWRLVYTIPSEQVDSYLKGDRIEFRDPLAAEDFASAGAGTGGSSLANKVRSRAAQARASGDSNVVTARIYPAPEAPGDVRVSVTESALVVNWPESALPPGASSREYRVYRAEIESGGESAERDISQVKLKTPLELAGASPSAEFRDTHFEFGKTYLYTVRSAAQFGADVVESADSVPAVVRARDVIPPTAPTGLEIVVIPATQQSAATVELSWAISPEADLAGYIVYRSDKEDTFGERVSAESLLSPTFRDISVLSGKQYFYRVSALDRAGNESPRSSAVRADVP